MNKGLVRKYEVPFPVLALVGKVSYRIQLPAWFKIHSVSHVSCLKPFYADAEDPSRNVPTRPTPTATLLERRVDSIMANRVRVLPNGAEETEYPVKWKGLPSYEASWELEY